MGKMLVTRHDGKIKENNYSGNLRSVKRSVRVTDTLSSTACALQRVREKRNKTLEYGEIKLQAKK